MAKKKKTELQKELKESASKIWLAGLGALSSAEEEGTKLFNTLVEKGESYETRGKKRINEMKARVEDVVGKAESSWEKMGDALDDRVADAIKRLGVPSRNEITKLTKRVEELTVKVDGLRPAPKKTTGSPNAG